MRIEMICNNKGVIVFEKNNRYLFSYGTLIMSWNEKKKQMYRHFNNDSIVSQTTSRHIHEFLDGLPVSPGKNLKQYAMGLKYKEVA